MAVCTLSEAISAFLNSDIKKSLGPEVRFAVSKINKVAKTLVDLFHRLSLSRRAQTAPIFNLFAEKTANVFSADGFL